jgi:hypothetical protein
MRAPRGYAATALTPVHLSDQRNRYYGLLGPQAQSITCSTAGVRQTVPTVGADGAYLIVTTGTSHRFTGAAGTVERRELDVADAVPVYGPISEIQYRGVR